ncbi:hypothetical protein, partial [Paenibacillus thiaminolyticus]|uniref:hypothetical protein n=2 Tax=Paenibacillus thiaminolyticus TaxID=49283 RepID=UPI0022829A4B
MYHGSGYEEGPPVALPLDSTALLISSINSFSYGEEAKKNTVSGNVIKIRRGNHNQAKEQVIE